MTESEIIGKGFDCPFCKVWHRTPEYLNDDKGEDKGVLCPNCARRIRLLDLPSSKDESFTFAIHPMQDKQ